MKRNKPIQQAVDAALVVANGILLVIVAIITLVLALILQVLTA